MKVFKFRVLLDADQDVFRDIELLESNCLEDFHKAIINAFGLTPGEMAAFYNSNEDWEQGEEIPLLDMGLTEVPSKLMCDNPVGQSFTMEEKHKLYVYDFFNMWTFFVELVAITDAQVKEYPDVTFVFGETPETAPEKDFEEGASAKNDLFGGAFDEEGEDFHHGDEDLWN